MTQQETNEQVNGLEQTTAEPQPLTSEEAEAAVGGWGHISFTQKCYFCGALFNSLTQESGCPHRMKHSAQ